MIIFVLYCHTLSSDSGLHKPVLIILKQSFCCIYLVVKYYFSVLCLSYNKHTLYSFKRLFFKTLVSVLFIISRSTSKSFSAEESNFAFNVWMWEVSLFFSSMDFIFKEFITTGLEKILNSELWKLTDKIWWRELLVNSHSYDVYM